MTMPSDRLELKNQINEIIEQKDLEVSPKLQKMLEETIYRLQTEPISLKEALNFGPEIMEKIYSSAYTMFQSGKYDDALKLFSYLKTLDDSDMRYTFCIASCHYYLKDYTSAAGHFLICKFLAQDPIACFHLYDCFLKLNDPLNALNALLECIAFCGTNPKYEAVKEKAQIELKSVEKLVKIYFQEKYGKDAVKDPV